MDLDPSITFEQVQEAREALRNIGTSHWLSDDLFSWKWWFLVAAGILPWVVWLKFFIDRKRVFEILTCGFLVGTFAVALDGIGVDLMLWAYPDKVLPMFPPLFPADLTVIPVSFMVIYQYTKTWKTYLLANLALAAFYAYLVESLFVVWEMFQLIRWTHTYSFLGFVLLGSINRWVMLKFAKLSER
ncbi:CBO0543 family protein [Paenibacillus antri]|uniref:CBO0543 family protein n=1 Tax=Paenibacillus antri TaxID=2582848 RepID=UPI001EE47A6B|nr:CBO0543 family protein [Paenibacillus antri]